MGYELQPRTPQAFQPPVEHSLMQVDDIVAFARLAWRRKWKILLGVLTGALAATAYITLSPPTYESNAQVLVMKRLPVGTEGPTAAAHYYFEDDMMTHVSLIKSPWFISDVVQKHQLQALPSLAEDRNPVRAIISQLSVVPESEEPVERPSSILKLSFRGRDPQDCTNVVSAIIDRYQEFLNETSRHANEDALRLITQKAETTRKELEDKKATYQQFRKMAPLLWNEGDRSRWNQTRLADIQTKRSDLSVRRAELQSRIAALRAPISPLDRAALAMTVPGTSYRDSAAMQAERILSDRLLPLLLQEKTLRKDYGPGHPDVRAIHEQIELARQFFTPSSATREPMLGATDQDRQVDPVQAYIHSLEQQIRDLEMSEHALDEQWKQQQDEARKVTDYEVLDRQQTEAIARVTRYYENLLAQLQGVDLNKELVGYRMRLIAPPETPAQVAPRAVLAMALAVFLGIVGGFGWGWVSESRDQSLRTPEDIRQRLGLPVLGCIPLLSSNGSPVPAASSQAAAMDSILCVHHRPDSAEAEAYRGVRTALYFSILTKRQKVIVITSPNVGDGKTTLAANLAVSLVRSGARVLLVDADLRRPRVHELFGRSARPGLTSVLLEEAELHQATQLSDIPGLWILPSGPLPSDPADLLTAPRFQDLLDAARQQYDFVLVDSSALLEATDARVVAARADAVLLTVRVTNNGRPQLERAREILGQLETNLLGAVVNATNRYAEFGASARKTEPTPPRYSRNGKHPVGSALDDGDKPREPVS